MASLRKKGIAFLKFAFSALLIYFVLTKVDIGQIFDIIKKADALFLCLALLCFAFSKLISAFRLNLYFRRLGIRLTQISNLKLYLLGMFYNLFLPGGVGGDAYKGYLIKKKFEIGTKKVISALIIDRLSGMLLLFIYACILALSLKDAIFYDHRGLLVSAIVLGILVFWIFNRKFFSYLFSVFWESLGLSALVQLAQLVSAWCILEALGIETDTIAYLFLFLVSSIVAVLPLTLGGIGSREVTFFYGALWLGLEKDASISVSMTFFLITALVSLTGIFYHFKKPELVVE